MKSGPLLAMMIAALSSAAMGCFVLTHDPGGARGVVTTTTAATLGDGGPARARPGTPAELADLSRDVR